MSETPASGPSPATDPSPMPAPAAEPENRPPLRPQRWPMVLSVLALIVSVASAALTVWLAVLVRNFDIHRAFVHVAGPVVASAADPGDRALRSVTLTAQFTNTGSAPTDGLMFFMRCATSKEPVAEPWTLLFQDKIEKQPLAIGPHATATAQCSFSAAQIQQMSEGKLHGYAMGDITYHGRRGDATLRRTQFSWHVSNVNIDPASKTVTLNASGIGQHNCVDAQCPLAIMTH